MIVDTQKHSDALNTGSSEPLDPDFDNSGTIHEKRRSTKLGSAEFRDQVPNIYISDESVKSWGRARRAYRRHRIGEFHSPKQSTLHYRSRQDYRRLLETCRQLQQRYQQLSTALISLRVPPMEGDSYIPPLDTVGALMDAIADVRDAINYRLREYNWEYARVVAGTDDFATPHVHLYLWIEGQPTFDQLKPAVEKFVEKCSLAPSNGKGNRAREGALTLKQDQDLRPSGETTGIVYVASQLPHIGYPDMIDDTSLEWGAVANATPRKLIACPYMSRDKIK